MKNYLTLGPVRLRISRKHLAPWGYAILQIGGMSFFSRTSSGDLFIAGYHPRRSTTWHWSVILCKRRGKPVDWINRAPRRRGQWHDYYWLPFGKQIIVSHQDYHLERVHQQSAPEKSNG